ASDNTTIRFNCEQDTLATRKLNRGEYLEQVVAATTFIEADRPISVAQLSKSTGCNQQAGPNMLILPPFAFQTKRASFQVLTGFGPVTVYRNHINVVTKTGAVSRLTLDGQPLNAAWQPVGSNPLYAFIQYPISPGPHVLASDSNFYATSYGFDFADAYTHSLGYEEVAPLQAPRDNVVTMSLGDDLPLCPGQSLVLNAASPGALGYRWQDGSADSVFTVREPGRYTVEVFTLCQVKTGSIEVTALAKPPNVFTPNGDGINDCFEVPGSGPGEWTLAVHNRWGKLVYHQKAYYNTWCAEGEANGVYFYQLTKPDGQSCTVKGWVHVLR
ncbi:MAG TPA: gliding motility-associated C-terminal domain-containing protein, partial [Cytophagales bacterium]